MTWFKVDDGFADHPKVIALQQRRGWKGALALWTLAGSWSARHLTEGHVPAAVLRRLGASKAEANALVAVGLWEIVDGGYRFHQWMERNPSKASIEADRSKIAERVRRHRQRKRSSSNQECNALPGGACNDAPPRAVNPTRPDPSVSLLRERERAGARETPPLSKAQPSDTRAPPPVPPKHVPLHLPDPLGEKPEVFPVEFVEREWIRARRAAGYGSVARTRASSLAFAALAEWATEHGSDEVREAVRRIKPDATPDDVWRSAVKTAIAGYLRDESKLRARHPLEWFANAPGDFLRQELGGAA